MRTILNESNNPSYNLAWEEYIFKHVACHDDILLLWQNVDSVIIGRNQNVWEEVNLDYAIKHQIPIIRRISGGGAVYHDLGNLNFSIITNEFKDSISNYRKFTEPLIDALADLGIEAVFHGKSDVFIGDKKISGNAQSYYQNRMLHHGTILFHASIDHMAEVLKQPTHEIDSIGVKSNRSQVTNVSRFMHHPMEMDAFKSFLLKAWLKTDHVENKVIRLTEADELAIQKIEREKYQTWEWNYGESPAFDIVKTRHYERLKVKVDNGLVELVDYFDGLKNWRIHHFVGTRFELNQLTELSNDIDDAIKPAIQRFLPLLFQ